MQAVFAVAALLLPVVAAQPEQTSKIAADMRPIRKVVTLLQEMKATCEKEAAEDLAAYEKYKCWCDTNEKEKKAAIEIAEQRIADLDTFIEEATAKAGELKTEIAGLEADIQEDKDAIATATALREKENKAFVEEEADMKETRYLLEEAIKTLKKVQLLQKPSGEHDDEKAANVALVQLRDHVQKRFPSFFGTMQRDLFDMMSSFKEASDRRNQGFLPKHQGAALEQASAEFRSTTLLPWQKTEEQIGMEAKPNDLKGMAAGAKSYNSRSGKILGILAEMHDEFSRDLGASQKAELQALIAFHELQAAKLAEIAEATKLKEQKEAALADTMDKIAKAKDDKAATEEAMAADQKFLANLLESCENEDNEYQKRLTVRSNEIQALTETLKILSSDESRDLYENTMSFVQVSKSSTALDAKMETAARMAAQDRAKDRAMRRIAEAAQKHNNWALAALGVRARLDKFTKVKAAMDKMMAELQKQQKEEYEKWEFCKESIDTTEDNIKAATRLKEDLAGEHKRLTNTIETLEANIAMLKTEVADMEVSLKQAGEERHAANKIYQTSVADQRATINILYKAKTRLEMFYNSSFIQMSRKQPVYAMGAGTGTYVNKPSGPAEVGYAKNAMSGSVIDLVQKVIEDATANEKELTASENGEQAEYAKFVNAAKDSIEADRASIREKQGQVAENKASLSECEEAQLANDADLATQIEIMKAHHLECDYLLKYFDVRQTARAEEMNAIGEAKAILSGADYLEK